MINYLYIPLFKVSLTIPNLSLTGLPCWQMYHLLQSKIQFVGILDWILQDITLKVDSWKVNIQQNRGKLLKNYIQHILIQSCKVMLGEALQCMGHSKIQQQLPEIRDTLNSRLFKPVPHFSQYAKLWCRPLQVLMVCSRFSLDCTLVLQNIPRQSVTFHLTGTTSIAAAFMPLFLPHFPNALICFKRSPQGCARQRS